MSAFSQSVINLVEQLNTKCLEATDGCSVGLSPFTFVTDGNTDGIEVWNVPVWDSDNYPMEDEVQLEVYVMEELDKLGEAVEIMARVVMRQKTKPQD